MSVFFGDIFFGDRPCKVSVSLSGSLGDRPFGFVGTDPAKCSVFHGDRPFGSSGG